MGIMDDAQNAMNANEAKVEEVIDQAGDFIDDKTNNQYVEQVDQAQEFLKDKIGEEHNPDPAAPPA